MERRLIQLVVAPDTALDEDNESVSSTTLFGLANDGTVWMLERPNHYTSRPYDWERLPSLPRDDDAETV